MHRSPSCSSRSRTCRRSSSSPLADAGPADPPRRLPAPGRRVRLRPRPDADRRGRRPAPADTSRDRVRTSRRDPVRRRHGTNVPVGAAVSRRRRARRLLPGRGRGRAGDRPVPAARADPPRIGAGGDRGGHRRGLPPQLLRRRRALRRGRDARGACVRRFPEHSDQRRRSAARLARAAADEARLGRRPARARRARGADEGALRPPPVHLEVPAVLEVLCGCCPPGEQAERQGGGHGEGCNRAPAPPSDHRDSPLAHRQCEDMLFGSYRVERSSSSHRRRTSHG